MDILPLFLPQKGEINIFLKNIHPWAMALGTYHLPPNILTINMSTCKNLISEECFAWSQYKPTM